MRLTEIEFAIPVADDLEAAAKELLGADDPAVVSSTQFALDRTEEGRTVVVATSRLVLGVVAELRRPVALSISFRPWEPRAVGRFKRRTSSAFGLPPAGVLVDDERVRRSWQVSVGDAADGSGPLDADPAVWPVMAALTSALGTGVFAVDEHAPVAPVSVPPPSGFRLGHIVIRFNGRFVVLIGPGARRNLSGSSTKTDLLRATDYIVNRFDAIPDEA
ncbi:MAG: hypothetical protein OEV40_04125 [Acidimicrobiia bacterium]|nr:hypothetical protein [Acidimicrobiia bacterium]